MAPEPLIEVRELCKHFQTFHRREGIWGGIQNLFVRDYRTVKAVDNVNFSADQGEMVGYIGPNGAGKSTTIKMLTGILVPSSGFVRVNGFDPHRQRPQYVKTIGVVFGQRTQLWWDIAVVESFKLLRRIYGVSQSDFNSRMEQFDEILGIKRLPAHAGAQTFTRRTDAMRPGRRAAAQSAVAFSGRADHRPGRGGERSHPSFSA